MICKELRIKDVIKEDLGRRIARIDPDAVLENNLKNGVTTNEFNINKYLTVK